MPLALGDGRTLAWSEGGDPAGTPVLFFHGCPDTRRAAWTGHDAAHAAGVRLIAANRPGYGASTPASPSYELVVGDVAELADSLGLDRFAVIGMSVGGTFALACAAYHPDRVSAVALVVESDASTAATVSEADVAAGPVEISADSGEIDGPVTDGGRPVDGDGAGPADDDLE